MKRCYKCRQPYLEPHVPGHDEVCGGCGSYLHCCQNCDLYDTSQKNSCREPMAEYVSDSNGMNYCEYFQFRRASSRSLDDDSGGRRFKRPDWRNINKKNDSPARRRRVPTGQGGRGGGRGRGGSSSGGGERAKKAREALEKLFKKP